MSNQPRPDWRRGKQGTTRGRGGETSVPSWKQRRSDESERRVSASRLRFAGLGLLLLILLGFFLYWLPAEVRKLPVIAVVVTDFTLPIPANALAREDLEQLEATNRDNLIVRSTTAGQVTAGQFLRVMAEQLAGRGGGPSNDVVLVYLNTHGVVDGAGRACLLFSDSRPWDSTTWVSAADVCQTLAETGTARKLLVFDCGQVASNWSLGQLHNSFSERLSSELSQLDLPDLRVLVSHRADQQSWSGPELGQSAFGYFLSEGLRGRADGRGSAGRRDDRVSLGELQAYLAASLQRWTSERRAAVQEPLLLPEAGAEKASDWLLVFAQRGAGQAPTAEELDRRAARVTRIEEQARSRLSRVAELWDAHQRFLETNDPLTTDPIGWADVQSRLLRLEELALAGKEYEGAFDNELTSAAAYLHRDTHPSLLGRLRPYSLSAERRWQGRSIDPLARDTWFAIWQANQGPKLKEGEPPPPRPTYALAADVIWQWLADQAVPARNRIRDGLDWIDATGGRLGTKGEPLADFAEVHFLRMLERHLERSSSDQFEERLAPVTPQAIRVRGLAEQAAVSPDARVHYWIQDQVNAADASRRVAEDRLFVGAEAELALASRDFTRLADASVAGSYPAVEAHAKTIHAYLALRDRALMELPWLAEWLLRRAHAEEAEQDRLENLMSETIQALHLFCAQLEEHVAAGRAAPDSELTRSLDLVRDGQGGLRRAFAEDVEYQRRAGGFDNQRLVELTGLLQVPLLSVPERRELRERHLQLLFQRQVFDDAADTGRASSPPAVVPRGKWRWSPRPHPALALLDRSRLRLLLAQRRLQLDLERPDTDVTLWLARQGQEVRRLLADVRETSNELEAVTNELLNASTETPAAKRAGLSEADWLTRAAAPLLGMRAWDDPETDPAHRLLALDLHYHTLWQCQRALDDCWGPARDREPSYFVQAGNQLLANARLLSDKPRSLRYRGDLVQLLATQQAALAAVRLKSDSVKLTGERELESHSLEVGWPDGLPAGVAAAFVSSAAPGPALAIVDESQRQAIRQPVSVSAAGKYELRRSLPVAKLAALGDAAQFSDRLLFRGHLFDSPFLLRRPRQTIDVVLRPQPPPGTRVLVTGESKRKAHLMFVLDCSGSMTRGGAPNRMERAKRALQDVLERLLKTKNYHVGLRAFAHRFAWDATATNFDPSPLARGQEIPPGVNPDTDVQVRVPLKFLNQEQFEKVFRELGVLQPWGSTPLYFSLKTSLEEDRFDPNVPGELKRIVVVTDGVNDTYKTHTPVTDVMRARKEGPNRDVRVDVILVDANEVLANPKESAKVKELERLAEETQGMFRAVNDARELADALNAIIKQGDYSVSELGQPVSERREIGTPWPVEGLDGSPRSYLVQLHGVPRPASTQIELQRGESLFIEYSRFEDKLLFPRYVPIEVDPADDVRDSREVVDPVSRGRYEVQALLPQEADSGRKVTFLASIQNMDPALFTPRPRHVWAEVQPLDQDEFVGEAIRFYDLDFVPERPVPVFRFVVQDWPKRATHAALKLWLKFREADAKPTEFDPLAENQFRLPELEGIGFRTLVEDVGAAGQGRRITVYEDHPSGGDLFALRVLASPAPDTLISHQYLVGLEAVKHVFEYSRSVRPKIQLTPRTLIQENAIDVPLMRVKIRK